MTNCKKKQKVLEKPPIHSSSTITVSPRCQLDLKSQIIQPDSAATDSDLKTIHYKWSWESIILFTTYRTFEFEATLTKI
jgi:hypothetical protein